VTFGEINRITSRDWIEHKLWFHSTIKFVCPHYMLANTKLTFALRAVHFVFWKAASRAKEQLQEESMFTIVKEESRDVDQHSLREFGVVAAVAIILFGATLSNEAYSQAATVHVATKHQTRSGKTLQTSAALRDLWVGHIFWVRNVSLAAIDNNDAALKAAEQQAVANAKSIAASIEPFYGATAKEAFFKLLAGHYGAVKAYLLATVAGTTSAQAAATQSLTSNAGDIAVFLSKANPYLPKDAVGSLLLAHGSHHIQQIQELKARNYTSEAKTWEDMKNHVYQIADATADALAKQYPEQF
jgi:hypothetical protein